MWPLLASYLVCPWIVVWFEVVVDVVNVVVVVVCCVDAAFEASTSVPRNNSSFWQLAFNAESSPAQVCVYIRENL